jgi:hypothetical protein
MPAAEGDRHLPLVPLRYAGGAGQRCDGCTVLTFSPHMLDGETRTTEAQPVPRRQSRLSAGAAVFGSPEGHGVATTVRVYRRRICDAWNGEPNRARQLPRTVRRHYCGALVPRQASDTMIK